MSVHAEVLALRERLGISYKDASHRLYMTECEKLKTDEKTQKAFSILKDRTREALVSFQKRLVQIGEPAKSLNADPDAERDPDADDFET
jgi:hypothetical protein